MCLILTQAHYFLNVSEPLRLQQLQAMAVLNHFQQDGMSIKLEAAGATKRRWSFVSAGSGSQLLERELNRLLGSDHAVGHGTRPIEQLINVKVYNSADKQISVVIFTFALQPAGAGAAWGVVHKTIQERQERGEWVCHWSGSWCYVCNGLLILLQHAAVLLQKIGSYPAQGWCFL